MATPIERVDAHVFTIPTDGPESDGTFAWNETTAIVVEVHAGGRAGLGWTYAHAAAADLATGPLARAVTGVDSSSIAAAWSSMNRAVRNIGRPGLAWEALSAVDIALWDLKARSLGVAVADLLGRAREDVMAYGSGGFTSYDEARLADQLGRWASAGFRAVKMKVGRDPAADPRRVRVAREAIGRDVELFVDANGAYDRKQAIAMAEAFAQSDVSWFEEPVSSDDVEGLRLVRGRAPAPIEIAAGEYGYVPADFRRLVEGRCLDVLQADVTRCGGITGMLAVSALAEAFELPLSAHCAPHVHAHVGCAARGLRHVEYFHDHARVERLLFEGTIEPREGRLRPDPARPGLGVTLARGAERFRARRA